MILLRPITRMAATMTIILAIGQPALAQAPVELQSRPPESDGRGLMMGLAALAVLGLAIREARDDDDEDDRNERPRVPARCLVDWPTRGGEVRLYDADCLDLEYRAAGRLPLDCAVTLRSRGRFVSGFSPDCLREEGWRLERN